MELIVALLQDHAYIDEVHVQGEIGLSLVALMKQVLNELGEVVRRNIAGLLAHGLEQVGGLVRFDGDLDASLDSECLELDVIRVVHLDKRLDGCLVEVVLLLRIQIERFLVRGLAAAKAGGQLPGDPGILLPDILVKLDVRPDLLDQEA